jgi:glycosyltransferase involved in cell wall biosynthesis
MRATEKPPRVSVTINFENAAPFLSEAIASVYAQTFDDWELILVDDGSTDGSAGIARAAIDRDPRVRYVQHPGGANRGMSASRNLGASVSAGEYLAWLDADDVWFPQKLEQQVAVLDAHPRAALVYGRTQHWYSWTGEGDDRDRDYLSVLGVDPNTLVEPPMLLTLALESRAPTPGPGEFLVRRASFERAGGFEEEWWTLFEDQVFLAKLYLAEPVFVSDEAWIRYRRHDRSSTRMAGAGGRYALGLLYLEWLERYLRENAVNEARLWRALRRKRRRYSHPRAYALAKRLRTRGLRPVDMRMLASMLRKRFALG